MPLLRRTFIARVGAVTAACAAPALRAQGSAFPSGTIRMLCAFAAGSADATLRALCEATSHVLGQPVVVENRPGASGTLAASTIARLKPDGYNLAQGTNGMLQLPHRTKTTFDPLADFTYIAAATGFSFGLVVRADAPWKTFGEFHDYARGHKGAVRYGIPAIGTAGHVAIDELSDKEGLGMTAIPFRGTADTMNSLLGGHIDAAAESTGFAPFVDAGKLRLLVLFTPKRLKRWPDVPTFAELGFDASDNSSLWGIVGPARMPAPVVQTLQEGFRKAGADENYLRVLNMNAMEPGFLDASNYRQYAQRQWEIQRRIVEKYKLKTDA